jgi:hypothetical protein
MTATREAKKYRTVNFENIERRVERKNYLNFLNAFDYFYTRKGGSANYL